MKKVVAQRPNEVLIEELPDEPTLKVPCNELNPELASVDIDDVDLSEVASPDRNQEENFPIFSIEKFLEVPWTILNGNGFESSTSTDDGKEPQIEVAHGTFIATAIECTGDQWQDVESIEDVNYEMISHAKEADIEFLSQ